MDHHPYGFSKWPALAVCPHYESDDRERKSAKDGTDNHECLSDYINEINTGVPALHDNDNARWAAQFIKQLSGDEIDVIRSETSVSVTNGLTAEGVFGTCDAHFITSDGYLYVFDYKSGGKSNIDHMPQVAGYAYALATSNSSINRDSIQCYVLYGADRKFTSKTYCFDELRKIATNVMLNVEDREKLEPCANGYCQYCKHNKECKEMAGKIIEFKNNTLASMSNAALYDWLVSAKSAIDRWIDDLKDIAKDNGGVLDDGKVRYELHTDKRGRMTAVDVPQLWYDMSDKGCSVTQDQLMKACTISKKAFTDLYKADAKAHGILVKDVEAQYASRCTFGEPATKLVKVEAK